MGRRSVEEHAARIAALLAPALAELGVEAVPLGGALGRISAVEVRSPMPLPPFRNSQMDGYAARAAEIAAVPVDLPVAGVQPAGPAEARTLPPWTLLKVMTGAPLPDGADCVVPVEDTEPGASGVIVRRGRAVGEYVREAGSDLAAGAVLVHAGTRLAPRHLAALAAAGLAAVPVVRRPRVAVLTTGEEVVEPGSPLRFGQVYDANRTALTALLQEAGADIVLAEHVPDDPGLFRAALDRAVAAADLVLTCGGISRGDFEVVRQVLEPLGADVTEVAMQPGGPQASATVGEVPVVGFPGNPVSTQVSFAVFVRPLLRRAAGLPALVEQRLPLAEALVSPVGRRQWLRGRVRDGRVHVVGGPGSHLVAAMASADVLIDVPADAEALADGAIVTVLPL